MRGRDPASKNKRSALRLLQVKERGENNEEGNLGKASLGMITALISMVPATQPSIEDITLGGLPWIPKVNFHNPFLASENGDEFMKYFHVAADGKSNPFILVLEGSVPNEDNKPAGYWASFGTDQATGQPITTCEWIDRLAPKAWAVIAAGTCSPHGGN